MKCVVGDREILEIYFNSASKNTSETDIFPHGIKPLLTKCNLKTFKSTLKHFLYMISSYSLDEYYKNNSQ
jgi:hypothetical protein